MTLTNGGRRRAAAPQRTTGRIAAIDIARGFAIIGMFLAHTMPNPDDAELLVEGRSSVLFATLAGVSLGLMTGGARRVDRDRRGAMRMTVLIRGLLLLVLGLLLWTLEHGVAIILDYYGVMFLCLIPLLFASRAVLTAVGVALLAVAPWLAGVVNQQLPPGRSVFGLDWFLTGYYPVLVWLPLLIGGLIAARSGLTRRKTQVIITLAGITGMVAGYGAAWVIPGVSAEAHSSTLAEILGSGGFAFTVIGLLLLVTAPQNGAIGRGIRGILWPIGAAGSMPLTLYTAQILGISAAFGITRNSTLDGVIDDLGWALPVILVAGGLLFASLWRALLGAGPLERLMRLASVAPGTDRPGH
ncbi:MAG: heparan-alpha-glucosaminide N-acetyltransferase domain-containing protein [Microbacteriaceae bacterium]